MQPCSTASSASGKPNRAFPLCPGTILVNGSSMTMWSGCFVEPCGCQVGTEFRIKRCAALRNLSQSKFRFLRRIVRIGFKTTCSCPDLATVCGGPRREANRRAASAFRPHTGSLRRLGLSVFSAFRRQQADSEILAAGRYLVSGRNPRKIMSVLGQGPDRGPGERVLVLRNPYEIEQRRRRPVGACTVFRRRVSP